ncbi:MAG: carbohydrate kinase [Spirochaetes bacterium]|nr:carbohydrate kinase [Spirochaetota bacterium]
MRIISFGEMLWDLFPEGPRFGGAPANFACHAALKHASVSMVSAVGADERGDNAVNILKQFGVDTSLVQTIPDKPTGAVNVTLDHAGKPEYVIQADAAWDHIAHTMELDERVARADAVYYGTLGQRGAASRTTLRFLLFGAKQRGIRRILDVNLRKPFIDDELIRESVMLASVLKVSDEELSAVAAACGVAAGGDPEPVMKELRVRYDLELVAMTRGADGALLVTASGTVHQPGIPTVVRDTVGAGDSFTAAMAVGLLHEEPVAVIARNACETAAAVCAQNGAVPDITGV